MSTEEASLNFDLNGNGSIRPTNISRTVAANFASQNEVDLYAIDAVTGAIPTASLTSPQQHLCPLIDLLDANGNALKYSISNNDDHASLEMAGQIAGQGTLKLYSQTSPPNNYEPTFNLINRDNYKNEVFDLTNAERLKVDLTPLKRRTLLDKAAQVHVEDMDASNRYLAPTGSNGSNAVSRIAATG